MILLLLLLRGGQHARAQSAQAARRAALPRCRRRLPPLCPPRRLPFSTPPIPAVLAKLPALKNLLLSHNQLTGQLTCALAAPALAELALAGGCEAG